MVVQEGIDSDVSLSGRDTGETGSGPQNAFPPFTQGNPFTF